MSKRKDPKKGNDNNNKQYLDQAIETVQQLNKRLDDYQQRAEKRMQRAIKKGKLDRRPPRPFEGSSFLYIRSYDGDTGARPFSGITFWLSPDISVAPITNLAAYTRELNAGETYQLNCVVRNAGDLHVPSAKVEFFLVNPSLGFDTRFATPLGVTSIWAGPFSSQAAALRYTVPSTESGHKCLFARVFSFSPLDIPVDDYGLDPRIDRHIGQLNLNIIPQATTFRFQLIHQPIANEQMVLLPVNQEMMQAMRHPLMADFTFNAEAPMDRFAAGAKLRVLSEHQEMKLNQRKNAFFFQSFGGDGPDEKQQKAVYDRLESALKSMAAGKGNRKELEPAFKAYRDMQKHTVKTDFEIHVPDLGLKPGEMTALDIAAYNRISRKIKGGLRIIVTG